jgi:hypothetical protein
MENYIFIPYTVLRNLKLIFKYELSNSGLKIVEAKAASSTRTDEDVKKYIPISFPKFKIISDSGNNFPTGNKYSELFFERLYYIEKT